MGANQNTGKPQVVRASQKLKALERAVEEYDALIEDDLDIPSAIRQKVWAAVGDVINCRCSEAMSPHEVRVALACVPPGASLQHAFHSPWKAAFPQSATPAQVNEEPLERVPNTATTGVSDIVLVGAEVDELRRSEGKTSRAKKATRPKKKRRS